MEAMLQQTKAIDGVAAVAVCEYHPASRFTAKQVIEHFFQPLTVVRDPLAEDSDRPSQRAFAAHQFMIDALSI